MNDKKFEKIKNKIYLCSKSQAIWGTYDFGTKIVPQYERKGF